MSEWTPGKWGAEGVMVWLLPSAENDISTFAIADCAFDGDRSEEVANAHLIAAAPDLAEVAQYALQITEDVFEGKVDPVTALDAICDLAKPAMARARGEAQ